MGLFSRKPKAEKRDWLADSFMMPQRSSYFSSSGAMVSIPSTLGLATAGAAIKLVSESIGMMPLKVYSGEPPNVAPARDSWQWFRLKDQPNDEQSAYDFWQDAATSIEVAGDAFIWKALSRRPIQDENDVQLFILDPANVTVKRDDNRRKYYEIRRKGQTERVPASQILQIRGWTYPPGADRGMSPIEQYREVLGNALAARGYSSTFYSNGVTATWGFSVPGQPTQESLDRLQLEFEQRHSGVSNAHKPLVLINEAKPFTTGISFRDAQYIEQQQFSAEEICRIFRVWPRMLGLVLGGGMPADDDLDRFLKVDLAPRIKRIEMALKSDPDLFPSGSELFPEFLTDAILRPSIQSRFAAYKDALQAGFMTADEIREKENLPAKGGVADSLQQTPVGGAPNQNGQSVPVNP